MSEPHDVHDVFRELSPEQCHTLLSVGVIGRVAFQSSQGLKLLPLNYLHQDEAIFFRVSQNGVLGELAHGVDEVAFQADHHEDMFRQAWSVVVSGATEEVVDPDEISALRSHRLLQPWAPGTREVFVRLTPSTISGRRVARRSG